mmetsp:Transcript_8665/g.22125  ORF Transcript_8665/g.22125 Transcript_8665/m.22125 type:complete len:257 (+) Transcript_8665:423-1193(+)
MSCAESPPMPYPSSTESIALTSCSLILVSMVSMAIWIAIPVSSGGNASSVFASDESSVAAAASSLRRVALTAATMALRARFAHVFATTRFACAGAIPSESARPETNALSPAASSSTLLDLPGAIASSTARLSSESRTESVFTRTATPFVAVARYRFAMSSVVACFPLTRLFCIAARIACASTKLLAVGGVSGGVGGVHQLGGMLSLSLAAALFASASLRSRARFSFSLMEGSGSSGTNAIFPPSVRSRIHLPFLPL